MYYNVYPYGHDYGNSETCGVTYLRGALEARKMPSASHEGSYDELERKVSGGSGSHNLVGALGPKCHIIESDNQSLYVGDLAIEQAPNIPVKMLTGRGNVARYWEPANLALLLATACEMISDLEFGLNVVTGLPIKSHADDHIRNVKQALDGSHRVLVDGQARTIHVDVKKVLMEGAGANIAHGNGGQNKIGVIDIGGRTTDLYLARGVRPVTDMCDSLDIGVETVFDRFREDFESTFRYSLSADDAAKIQQCYLNRMSYAGVATVVNAKADHKKIDDLIERAMTSVGKNIISNIKRVWHGSLSTATVAGDVSEVMLIGGGAYYFKDHITSLFDGRLTIPPMPEYANAMGYARLAHMFVQRESSRRVS